jgi:hypothetical protein
VHRQCSQRSGTWQDPHRCGGVPTMCAKLQWQHLLGTPKLGFGDSRTQACAGHPQRSAVGRLCKSCRWCLLHAAHAGRQQHEAVVQWRPAVPAAVCGHKPACECCCVLYLNRAKSQPERILWLGVYSFAHCPWAPCTTAGKVGNLATGAPGSCRQKLCVDSCGGLRYIVWGSPSVSAPRLLWQEAGVGGFITCCSCQPANRAHQLSPADIRRCCVQPCRRHFVWCSAAVHAPSASPLVHLVPFYCVMHTGLLAALPCGVMLRCACRKAGCGALCNPPLSCCVVFFCSKVIRAGRTLQLPLCAQPECVAGQTPVAPDSNTCWATPSASSKWWLPSALCSPATQQGCALHLCEGMPARSAGPLAGVVLLPRFGVQLKSVAVARGRGRLAQHCIQEAPSLCLLHLVATCAPGGRSWSSIAKQCSGPQLPLAMAIGEACARPPVSRPGAPEGSVAAEVKPVEVHGKAICQGFWVSAGVLVVPPRHSGSCRVVGQ